MKIINKKLTYLRGKAVSYMYTIELVAPGIPNPWTYRTLNLVLILHILKKNNNQNKYKT